MLEVKPQPGSGAARADVTAKLAELQENLRLIDHNIDVDRGRLAAGDADQDVTFADADPDLNDQIDAAYREKYRRYGPRIVGSVVNPEARAATIKLVPRG